MGDRRRMVGLSAIAGTLFAYFVSSLPAEGAEEQKKLVRQGARLWAPACGACHNARPPGERSPAEWEVIMMHMRVRANLPAEEARAILEYLKAR